MKLRSRDITFEAGVIAVVSTWESLALLSNRLPTVTSQVRRLPYPLRVVLVAGVSYWMADHFNLTIRGGTSAVTKGN